MTETDEMRSAQDVAALQCNSVSKIYPSQASLFSRRSDIEVLHDVSLEIPANSCVALVGESGSGKSTLARLLLGLELPTRGSINVFGRAANTIPRRAIVRMIQPVFQDPSGSLNPKHTIRRVLETPLRIHGVQDRSARERRIEELLELTQIPTRVLDLKPSSLSGGQQQRIAIARALLLDPQIVILDEPTSALDVSVQAQILRLLKKLQRSFRLTYFFITHDFGVVNVIADHVAVMFKGEIVEHGPSGKVLPSPSHPYTQALMKATLSFPRERASI